MDGRRNNGAKKGENRGAGRKPKVAEAKAKSIINAAIRKITGEDDDNTAQIQYLVDWDAEDPKGAKKFINEHAHGKPKEKVDIVTKEDNGESYDLSKLSTDQLKTFLKLVDILNED